MSEDVVYFWIKDVDGYMWLGLIKVVYEIFGEVKYVELLVIGDKVSQNSVFLSVEVIKVVFEFNCLINGIVVVVNLVLSENFDVLNSVEDGVVWLIDVD